MGLLLEGQNFHGRHGGNLWAVDGGGGGAGSVTFASLLWAPLSVSLIKMSGAPKCYNGRQ